MPPAHQYDELVHGPDKAPIRSWNCQYRSDIPSARLPSVHAPGQHRGWEDTCRKSASTLRPLCLIWWAYVYCRQ